MKHAELEEDFSTNAINSSYLLPTKGWWFDERKVEGWRSSKN